MPTLFPLTRLGLAAGLAILLGSSAHAGDITVFAAASMKNAMDEIATRYHDDTGNTAHVSLAGSSALARQIQQGAPADIFISANVDWMDTLQDGGLIKAESRVDLLNNSIVLVATGTGGAGAAPLSITPDLDLAGMLGADGHLAMALVDAVPAGIYGKAALESLGLWNSVAPRVAQADNVRAALALVSSGEAPFGIVYSTDAAADDGVSVVATFPAGSHPDIIYPAAILASSDNPDDAAFMAYLQGAVAREAFERQGFVVLPAAG